MKNLVAATLVSSLVATSSWACPAFVSGKDVPSLQGDRQDVRLFALEEKAGIRTWRSLPVQVDPLDDKGVLLSPTDQAIATHDRFALRRENFGLKATTADPMPCAGATQIVEVGNPEATGAYGYLTVCPNDGGKTLAREAGPVAVDQKIHKIKASRFEYDYQPNNQLMYKSLIAKGPWGAPILAAADADLNLHLDVKNFFTMDFTNKDVESYVGSTNTGKVGAAGSIDFFLNVLFFKINLKMATTASFFSDSGHIPSLIDVPVEAPNRLHPGSGLLYSWTLKDSTVDQSNPTKTLPNADPKQILAGTAALAKTGLEYCRGEQCVFRLRGDVADEHFGIDINVARKVVEMGFFPVYVADVAQFQKEMGWDDEPAATPHRVAVFFNNSGLHKGQYQLDQWIRVGKTEDFASVCPRPVRLLGNVNLAPVPTAH